MYCINNKKFNKRKIKKNFKIGKSEMPISDIVGGVDQEASVWGE